jgi:hypothetical protein
MATNHSLKGRGHIPDQDDAQDLMINMKALHADVNLGNISSIDLFTNKFTFADGQEKSYEPFVYNQEQVNSCTSNAVAAAYRYMLQRHCAPDFKPSRLFLYYLARTSDETITKAGFTDEERGSYYADLKFHLPKEPIVKDSGSGIRENIRILAKLGVPSETDWPYNIDFPSAKDEVSKEEVFPATSNVASCPHPKTLFTDLPKPFKFHYVRPMRDILDCWKQCIANGHPIICGIDEFEGFQKLTTKAPFCAKTPTKEDIYDTQHTVLIVGWDNDHQDNDGKKGCFKVQNSWGTDPDNEWDGFFWMPYDWVSVDSPNVSRDDDGVLAKPNKMVSSPWVLVDRADLVQGAT